MTNQDRIEAPQELVIAVGEVNGYVFDFTDLLRSGETISSVTGVTASTSGKVDIGTPAANAAQIDQDLSAGIEENIAIGKAVEVTLTGQAAATVVLTCTVVTSDSNTRIQRGVLVIIA